MKRVVLFTALVDADGDRDGQEGWSISVDGVDVCEVDSDEMDIADNALSPPWEALELEVKFDYD